MIPENASYNFSEKIRPISQIYSNCSVKISKMLAATFKDITQTFLEEPKYTSSNIVSI